MFPPHNPKNQIFSKFFFYYIGNGKFKTIGLPFTLSNYKPDYKRAPDLGENNKEILSSLGYDPDQIEKLTEEGVISKAKGPKNPRTEVIKGE